MLNGGYISHKTDKGEIIELTDCCPHSHDQHIVSQNPEGGEALPFEQWTRPCTVEGCECKNWHAMSRVEAIRKYDHREPTQDDSPCAPFAMEKGEMLIEAINTGRCTYQDKSGYACNE